MAVRHADAVLGGDTLADWSFGLTVVLPPWCLVDEVMQFAVIVASLSLLVCLACLGCFDW